MKITLALLLLGVVTLPAQAPGPTVAATGVLWVGQVGAVTGMFPVVPSSLPGVEVISQRGAANGYAPLDATGKVPAANLPSLTSAVPGASAALCANTNAVGGPSLIITRYSDGTCTQSQIVGPGQTFATAQNWGGTRVYRELAASKSVLVVGVDGSGAPVFRWSDGARVR